MYKTIEELIAEADARGKQRKHPHEEEHRIQCACVRWFRYSYPTIRNLLFAVPNGGRRDATTAVKLKAEGVVAGVADLILLIPRGEYGALLIEMKTPKGSQSTAQKEWQKLAEAQGYRYIICRSLDDFMTKVEAYLNETESKPKQN